MSPEVSCEVDELRTKWLKSRQRGLGSWGPAARPLATRHKHMKTVFVHLCICKILYCTHLVLVPYVTTDHNRDRRTSFYYSSMEHGHTHAYNDLFYKQLTVLAAKIANTV